VVTPIGLLSVLIDHSFFSHVNGIHVGDDPEGKKKGLMEKVKGIRDGLSDRIPQQHKDKATDHINHGKHFLSEEYFPEVVGCSFGCRPSSSARSTAIIRNLSSGSCRLPRSTLSTPSTPPTKARIVMSPLSHP
jgi:hypothetical protein